MCLSNEANLWFKCVGEVSKNTFFFGLEITLVRYIIQTRYHIQRAELSSRGWGLCALHR